MLLILIGLVCAGAPQTHRDMWHGITFTRALCCRGLWHLVSALKYNVVYCWAQRNHHFDDISVVMFQRLCGQHTHYRGIHAVRTSSSEPDQTGWGTACSLHLTSMYILHIICMLQAWSLCTSHNLVVFLPCETNGLQIHTCVLQPAFLRNLTSTKFQNVFIILKLTLNSF